MANPLGRLYCSWVAEPLFELGGGWLATSNFDPVVDHDCRCGKYTVPTDFVGVVDHFNVGCHPGPHHGVNDHCVDGVADQAASAENTDDKAVVLPVLHAQELFVFCSYGFSVFFFQAGWDIILVLYLLKYKDSRLIKAHLLGKGLVESDVKTHKANGCCADLYHPAGGSIHFYSIVLGVVNFVMV